MPQQINLIDASLQPSVQRFSPVALLAALGVAATLLAGHHGWERWALARALAQAIAPPPATAEPAFDASAQTQRADRLAQREALRDLLRHQVSVSEGSAALLGAIIRALPETMWLTELEAGASRALRISGAAADSASFGQFTARLEVIPALKSLPLHTVRLEPRVVEATSTGETQPAPTASLFVLASGTADDAAGTQAALSARGAKP